MAARRYYYSNSITDFLSRSINEIVGVLTRASLHDVNDETSKSWVEEIETMREVLGPYEGRGSVYFEYNIPRMGRRVDVIAVIDGIVFELEYKTAERKFSREALHLNEHEAAKWLTKDELDGVKWLPADVEVVEVIKSKIQ